MTEQQMTITDRAAAARAARSLRSQERLADRLAALGWKCTPPPAELPTASAAAALERRAAWELDASNEVAEIIHGRTLVVNDAPGSEHERYWDAYGVDSDGFRAAGAPNRVTLICHGRPADPVVVEVLVRVVEGQVP